MIGLATAGLMCSVSVREPCRATHSSSSSRQAGRQAGRQAQQRQTHCTWSSGHVHGLVVVEGAYAHAVVHTKPLGLCSWARRQLQQETRERLVSSQGLQQQQHLKRRGESSSSSACGAVLGFGTECTVKQQRTHSATAPVTAQHTSCRSLCTLIAPTPFHLLYFTKGCPSHLQEQGVTALELPGGCTPVLQLQLL